jgi:hypothetical protein
LAGAFEASIIDNLRAQINAELEHGLSSDELSKLTVKLIGTSLSSLSLDLSGPAEIVEKAQKAVGAE